MRRVAADVLRLVHSWAKGSRHGRGASSAHCGVRVHFAHIAAALSCTAMAFTSFGHISRMSKCLPALSTKVW